MDTLHRIMAVNLNAAKSIDLDMLVGLKLTDGPRNNRKDSADYTLDVRKGIFEVNPPSSGVPQFVIITDTLTWKNLVLAKLDPAVAVTDGVVVISGGTPQDFYSFMDLFE
jgi:hypothetical protein